VYRFNVDVIAGDVKHNFQAETDMPWGDFKSRVLAYLDSADKEVELISKFAGDSGRASHLDNAETFSVVMERLCQKVSNVRTRAVGLEVKNGAKCTTVAVKPKKKTRKDDVPPSPSDEDTTQLKAYKQLESQIRCELHCGHCFIDRTSGCDNHRHLNHAEMTLWAKKISPGGPPLLSQPRDHSEPLSLSSSPPIPDPYYPLIRVVLGLIDVKRPELQFGDLKMSLLDAGVVSSSQVVLLPEEVLSLIGDMGQKRARILRNYAKHIVLPLLRLSGAYEETEI
ncbi:uncharacterized protein EDB91DRAFT_1028277, partial [Suillus paluster]|uniref:uncharacterized protein n=1 Tax=Suillus paluster TaxID=48578 RepID=UPI001B88350A